MNLAYVRTGELDCGIMTNRCGCKNNVIVHKTTSWVVVGIVVVFPFIIPQYPLLTINASAGGVCCLTIWSGTGVLFSYFLLLSFYVVCSTVSSWVKLQLCRSRNVTCNTAFKHNGNPGTTDLSP